MESYNITITKLFFDQYNNKTFDDITRNLLDEKVDGVLIATLFTDSVIRLSQELDRNEIPYVYVDSNIEGQHQLAYFGTESYDASHCSPIADGSAFAHLRYFDGTDCS